MMHETIIKLQANWLENWSHRQSHGRDKNRNEQKKTKFLNLMRCEARVEEKEEKEGTWFNQMNMLKL